jgi:hypothetical protein
MDGAGVPLGGQSVTVLETARFLAIQVCVNACRHTSNAILP